MQQPDYRDQSAHRVKGQNMHLSKTEEADNKEKDQDTQQPEGKETDTTEVCQLTLQSQGAPSGIFSDQFSEMFWNSCMYSRTCPQSC